MSIRDIHVNDDLSVPQTLLSVGVPKQSPLWPSQVRNLWRTPPWQEEEHPDHAPHTDHALLRPPLFLSFNVNPVPLVANPLVLVVAGVVALGQTASLQSAVSCPCPLHPPSPSPALRGTPRITTTLTAEAQVLRMPFTGSGILPNLVLVVLPLPQETEQEVQAPQSLQLLPPGTRWLLCLPYLDKVQSCRSWS